MYKNIQKPILKWVGGKTQIIDKVLGLFPKKIKNYHELFIGGGSILFGLLSLIETGDITLEGQIFVYDKNNDLINFYKNIKNNYIEFYNYAKKYFDEYDSIDNIEINRKPKNINEAKSSKESYYYWIRNKFNKMAEDNENNSVEYSAIFLFINKTCFRGMFRIGPNGYNVPYGHYKTTPNLIGLDELKKISEMLSNVIFKVSDFTESIKEIKSEDFVYLDPPYVPENKTSFVGYRKDGFDNELHKKLFGEINNLHKKGVKFIMSNSNQKLVRESLKDYNCKEIIARRAINSKNPSSKTKEVLIYN
jgi:DNA adenine methylase